MINKRKLWKTVLTSWFFTFLGMFNLFVSFVFLAFIAVRFRGPAAFVAILGPLVAFTLASFLFSEGLVNILFRAKKPHPVKHASFINAAKKLRKRSHMWIKPRLRILTLDVPNAMAYGCGLPGLSAIGVTQELFELLNDDELEAVVAHEFAHIKCRDVGILTLIAIITGGVEKIKNLLLGGQTPLGKGPFAYILGFAFWFLSRFVFGLMRCSIAQERELAADALGSSYVGSPEPLISALTKLQSSRIDNPEKEKHMFDDLMVSHPGTEERIDSLISLGGNVNEY